VTRSTRKGDELADVRLLITRSQSKTMLDATTGGLGIAFEMETLEKPNAPPRITTFVTESDK
jgi:hypothetical protein